jgi:hypothetical protein
MLHAASCHAPCRIMPCSMPHHAMLHAASCHAPLTLLTSPSLTSPHLSFLIGPALLYAAMRVCCVDGFASVADVWGLAPELAPKGGANIPLRAAAAPIALAASSLQAYTSLGPAASVPLQAQAPAAPSEAQAPHQHHGAELWWTFQFVDTAVEDAINAAEARLGSRALLGQDASHKVRSPLPVACSRARR